MSISYGNKIMNHYQINNLLFSTNSIFHNKGLSIYGFRPKLVKTHAMNFPDSIPKMANIQLTDFSDYLNQLGDFELKNILLEKSEDAVLTFQKIGTSAGRIGVLISHINLIDQMRPHIHRQAYSDTIRPTMTVHYRISGANKSTFQFYDSISKELILKNNLCDNDAIVEWCKDKNLNSLPLEKNKNVILFNSGCVPHNVLHTSNLDLYFIFDNIILKNHSDSDFLYPTIYPE